MIQKIFTQKPIFVGVLFGFALVSCDQFKKIGGAVETLKTEATKVQAKVAPEARKAEASASAASPPGDSVSQLAETDYENFISRKNALVIVAYHASWCGPCRMLGPVLESVTRAHPGVVYLGKVDVDRAPKLAAAQGVSGIPDVRFYKNGVEVNRFTGFRDEKELKNLVEKLSQGIAPASAKLAPVVAPSENPVGTPAVKEPTMSPFQKGWMPSGMTRKGVEDP
jgi:thioredoxin